ncbi:hypothetical protein BEL01nite_67080 [Bradyrhizobium elkanii]|nr:hypothetical protein BEL01nite_67080 [Bradyrhizobium elkanii]
MGAVGADQGATFDLTAICELRPNSLVVLAEPDNMGVQMDGVRLQSPHTVDKDLKQVRAQQKIGLVPGRVGAPIIERPRFTGVPEPDGTSLGRDAILFDLLGEAEIAKYAHTVHGDPKAGAYLAQLGRLLENVAIDAASKQR